MSSAEGRDLAIDGRTTACAGYDLSQKTSQTDRKRPTADEIAQFVAAPTLRAHHFDHGCR